MSEAGAAPRPGLVTRPAGGARIGAGIVLVLLGCAALAWAVLGMFEPGTPDAGDVVSGLLGLPLSTAQAALALHTWVLGVALVVVGVLTLLIAAVVVFVLMLRQHEPALSSPVSRNRRIAGALLTGYGVAGLGWIGYWRFALLAMIWGYLGFRQLWAVTLAGEWGLVLQAAGSALLTLNAAAGIACCVAAIVLLRSRSSR
ncbi:hypothetical protein ABZ639_30010 [Saccharomonospora sp. NPDC006951]